MMSIAEQVVFLYMERKDRLGDPNFPKVWRIDTYGNFISVELRHRDRVSTGYAKRNPIDKPNLSTGVQIATHRALKRLYEESE